MFDAILQSLLGVLTAPFGQALLVLLALVLVDLVLGVSRAIKDKDFQFLKLGEFYKTKILLQIGGWIVLVLASRFALNGMVPDTTDPTYNGLFTGGAGVAWSVVASNLFASIAVNFAVIFGIPLPGSK